MLKKQLFMGLLFSVATVYALSVDPAQEQALVAHSTNRFSTDLYAQLCKESGNIVFSPYSIYTALAMPYAGAQGITEKEMSNVLHIPLAQEQFHQANAQLAKQISQRDGPCELSIANHIFIQQDFSVLPEFAKIITDKYGAAFENVDFSKQETTATLINQWVAQETHDKIQNIILPRHLTPTPTMVLVNAIYFKGKWKKPFNPMYTHQASFCLKEISCTDVAMMVQQNTFNYMENNTLQMLELPYEDDSFSMYLLLPKTLDGLTQIENMLTPAKLTSWIAQLQQQEVTVKLPKFTLETEYMLAEILANMGMNSAFTCANFSGIAHDTSLTLSKVIHKTFIEVEEEGTEATSSTAITMSRSFCRLPQETAALFNADHPFMFLIQDKATNVTLFLGKVTKP